MKKVMGIQECVDVYAQKRGITKIQAREEFDSMLEIITYACTQQGGVSFRGLFSLKKQVRKGREGVLNGKPFKTSDKNVLKFTLGSELDKMMNE